MICLVGVTDYERALSMHIGVARLFLLVLKDDSEATKKKLGKMYRRQGWVGEKDAMTVKETLEEMNRLKSNCNAKSNIYAFLVVYCLSLLSRYGYAYVPNPFLKALKE